MLEEFHEHGHFRYRIRNFVDVTGLGNKTKAANELKIAQWINVFEHTGGTGAVRWATNAFDRDLDSFVVRISGAPTLSAGANHRVKIWTEVDSGAEVELYPVAGQSGVYQTKTLCLVADDVDDQEPIDGVADGALNDRTFKVSLDGHLKIKLITAGAGGGTPDRELPVPKKKTVKVKGYVMQSGSFILADAIPVATADSYIGYAASCFASCGVKVEGSSASTPNPPGLSFGYFHAFEIPYYDSSTGVTTLTPQSLTLFSGTSVPANTGPCYFVSDFNSPSVSGVTMVAKTMTGASTPYANRILLDSNGLSDSTLAHEMLHVLTNGVHDRPYNNFMFEFNNTDWCLWHKNAPTGVFGRKRITDQMRYKILSSPFAK